jgi:uncharacterized protein (TIGR03118 family)
MPLPQRLPRPNGITLAGFLLAMAVLPQSGVAQYRQINLVSDLPRSQIHAIFRDPNLVNPWGMSFSPTSPIWVSDNGTGVSTLYRGPIGLRRSLVVTIPPPPGGAGPAAPSGTVFNGTGEFMVSKGAKSGSAFFLFATEDGTISGWNPTVDPTNAIIAVDNSSSPGVDNTTSQALYKGLAIGSAQGKNYIYATNFRDGVVEAYDGGFNFVGSFTDPNVTPDASDPGFAPFGIQNIGDKLYVTFAMQDADKKDDVKGAGLGFVDVFDLQGNFVAQFANGGTLNAPWGLAMAPSNFGTFSNDVLVGNFGDGRINAFDPSTTPATFKGQLTKSDGTPITIDGLWALAFGNGANAQRKNFLFFTAGIEDEAHGLFGRISSIAP